MKFFLMFCGILENENKSCYLCTVGLCLFVIKEGDDLHSLSDALIRWHVGCRNKRKHETKKERMLHLHRNIFCNSTYFYFLCNMAHSPVDDGTV